MRREPPATRGWTRDELYRRMLANMTRFYRRMGEGTGGVLERDGVLACLCPPAPTRSFFNAVVYTDGDANGSSLWRSTTNHAFWSSSLSSWPGPQPA